MPLAVRFREAMHGTWYRLAHADSELPASVEIENELSLVRLATTSRAHASGRLSLDGHVTDAIVRGDMRFDSRTKTVSYVFPYVADDGVHHRFVGQKDILPIHFPEGVLGLYATLYRIDRRGERRGESRTAVDEENEVGRVCLRTSSTSPIWDTLRSLRVGRESA